MKHTLIHVSDIHYQQDWAEEVGVISHAFFEDIKTQIHTTHAPFLVLSGDLIAHGGDQDELAAFESDFIGRVATLGIPRERRIVVPGNHDVSRAVIKPTLHMRNAALTAASDETEFNNALAHLLPTYLRPAFSDYHALESRIAAFGCAADITGSGWQLTDGLAAYCLNSALTSSAGLHDRHGNAIADKGALLVDTRRLYRWIQNQGSGDRLLVAHHPPTHLASWAATEIERTISNNFTLCLFGHTHQPDSAYAFRTRGAVSCIAPALFTRKNEPTGYAIIELDTDRREVSVRYRQWASGGARFVPGTVFAGNETGICVLPLAADEVAAQAPASRDLSATTAELLQAEFDEATACYSSRHSLWVTRDLSSIPETKAGKGDHHKLTEQDLITSPRSCVVRAPNQYGLSSLARRIALEHHKESSSGAVMLVFIASECPADDKSLSKIVERRCGALSVKPDRIAGFIFDNWQNDKHSARVAKTLARLYPNRVTMVMHSVDDCTHIESALRIDADMEAQTLYLWALDRQRIRQLVEQYAEARDDIDESLLANRVISDIDALNIHRTPLNCLLLLKYAEDVSQQTPVNRTAVIERVLFLLFHEFNRIPRYTTKPDVKDCEAVLGYFCETLIRGNKRTFTKDYFFATVRTFTSEQLLQVDADVLLAFLVGENILAHRGTEFVFRFVYWMHFFAAHRMHHDTDFAEFVLTDRRYAAFPELVEFYAGIDRRRSNAVKRLADDLCDMNREFLARAGIPDQFDPFLAARWEPTPDDVQRMEAQVSGAVADSALPTSVKDAIADRHYNRSLPYNQALADFFKQASFLQLLLAMKGGARTLRNSDYVKPDDKARLLREVVSCWVNVCRVLVVISPVLAQQKQAVFEDTCFYLSDEWDTSDRSKLWRSIMNAVMGNVVNWYEEDLFSQKMAPLFASFVGSDAEPMGRVLVMMVMIRNRPSGWEKTVEEFLLKSDRNAFYMWQAFAELVAEFRHGFTNERGRQALRRLAAIAIARHQKNIKVPNQQVIEKAAQALEDEVLRGKSDTPDAMQPDPGKTGGSVESDGE